jgi:hypothetical protein
MATRTRKRKRNQRKFYIIGMILAGAVLCVSVLMMVLAHFGLFSTHKNKNPDGFLPQVEVIQNDTEHLGYDLELQGVGRYAGIFLEDGSNDSVSDILMIKIKNTGDKDLQLARLSLTYSDFTAEFEITNLPAGRTVVVLEKNRHSYTDQKYLSVALTDVAFFGTHMDVCKHSYEITGMDGALNLKNISGSDITGDIYVYYKYTTGDELYGGITFRVKAEGGLRSGEIRQLISSHFDPDHCIILSVNAGA